ncbi:pectinesterase precursor [Colletotrichum kahawae]|uniref:Pectinesterase n=1 Tax=Colletotrichum kahawae TaxID=34407 RepID=A0AAE0DEW8_COLKA|nr:pectinesterase precursor [Colletotrichum kahawae]
MAPVEDLKHSPDVQDLPRRPHLELFNTDPAACGDASFHLFPQLPTELRLLIWQRALQRNRLLHVTIDEVERESADETPRYCLVNALGRPVTGDHYRVTVQVRCRLLPELMSVTHESREAARAFYPLSLPCHLKSATGTQKTVLLLNLSYDYLAISSGPSWKATIDFLHDLRAHDPSGTGLQHLVLDHADADPAPLKPTDIDAAALAAFHATLRALKSIWFRNITQGGRALDVLTFIRAHVLNYGHPVVPSFTFFDTPRRDPRNISRDLEKVWAGTYDPRGKPLAWRRLLRSLGVDPERDLDPAVDVRVMVGADREADVRSREDARRCLHEEDFGWLRLQWWFLGWEGGEDWGRAGCFGTSSGLIPCLPSFDSPGVLAAAVRPALGFWLFPVDAFGGLREDEDPDGWLKIKGLFDLKGSWPDLALAHIS